MSNSEFRSGFFIVLLLYSTQLFTAALFKCICNAVG